MRVVMFVMNDVVHDSRVRREAATLAAAGHQVTVMGLLPDPSGDAGSRPPVEVSDGFRILRVAAPAGTRWWVTFVRTPWRSIGPALRAGSRAAGRGPRGWLQAAGLLGGTLLALPYIVLRAPWYGFWNRLTGHPVRLGLEYLRRWRVEVGGWAELAVAAAPLADVHHGHDMEGLVAASRAATRDRARLVYDSHEIFTAWGKLLQQPRWLQGAMRAWEGRLARRAEAVVTINPLVAGELRRRLHPRALVVVHNCPPRWDPPVPPEDRFRRTLDIPADAPIVLCHGGFSGGRGLAETASAVARPGLVGAHLVFMGYGTGALAPILADPRLKGRVHFVPAVPPDDVVAWVAGADVDVMAILPTDENAVLSSPNKLFESLAAGVPVVSSDLPARRAIIKGEGGPLGALCDPTDVDSIAAAITSIVGLDPEQREAWRARCLQAAHRRWNWEAEGGRLVALYARLASASQRKPPGARVA